ncbi:uncharacterized protein LOC106471048 [Limulus polyphemus]|uniref:Uncharacterized protein LOC106471048 n=1 Tax=Limulus polyphemus TaxID=6850 RepID=A0ABM1BR69_LIMPO|nr:uncharacterized protein LOC106471048 [Limulus polyphemus]
MKTSLTILVVIILLSYTWHCDGSPIEGVDKSDADLVLEKAALSESLRDLFSDNPDSPLSRATDFIRELTDNIRFFVERVVGAVQNAVSGFRNSLDGARSEQNATSSLLTQGKNAPVYIDKINE